MFKVKLLISSLLVVMALGAAAATVALANPGPFLYHREPGKQASQQKIKEQSPEAFEGKGSGMELNATIGGTKVVLVCTLDAKGSVWNNKTQGQGKASIVYELCKVTNITECTATVASEGEYTLLFVWKYEEFAKELENKQQKLQGQKPDTDVIPRATSLVLNEEGKELEVTKGNFLTVKFSKCGVFTGLSDKAEGSTAFSFQPEPDQYAKEFKLTFPGSMPKQHAWWPPEQKFIALMQKLDLAGGEAKFSGELPITFASQEVAVDEN
jgi:hypothetical protein